MQRRHLIAAVPLAGLAALAATRARATTADVTRHEMFFDPAAPVLGNPKGALPIAEFFDYRCPYCRGMHRLFANLLAANPDIRFVAKEWPVFGGPSVTAARVALAADWQGRFRAANDALFTSNIADDAAVMQAVRQAGLDMAKLEQDMKTRASALDDALGTVELQAAGLGLQGTPGLIIGNYLIPGALDAENLAHVVHDARANLGGTAG